MSSVLLIMLNPSNDNSVESLCHCYLACLSLFRHILFPELKRDHFYATSNCLEIGMDLLCGFTETNKYYR